jgi:hypothetical protein
MSYDAITIDTQVIYANGLELDTGLVGQLDQYEDGLVKFVLSEINLREIHKALTEKAKTSQDSLAKAVKSGSANGQLEPDQLDALKAVQDAMLQPREHAKKQITEFIAKTGAEIVAADRAEIKPILEKYFKNEPPFASKGKKNEFPDAIALLSLESWAKEKGKKILAVSNDDDWKTFAKDCQYIDVVEDLAKAMALLNELAAATIPKAKAVLDAIRAEDNDTIGMLQARLESAVEAEFPYLEFDGPMPGENDGTSLSLVSYGIEGLDDGSTEIDVVRVGNGTFAFRVPVFITANVYADISFSIRDSIDKDYVPMGSTSIEQETDFHAHLLLDCSHFLNDPDDETSTIYEIEDVELLGAPDSIDVGYIEYSLADDDYDFDVDSLQ